MWVTLDIITYDGRSVRTEIVTRFQCETYNPNPGWQPPYERTLEPPEHVPRRKTYA
jgi:hypothetical protein